MIEHVCYEEWCAADRRHGAPTFFARPSWARALCDTSSGVEPFAFRVRIAGQRLLVPGLHSRTRLHFQEIVAFPLGGYTCVLDERGRAVEESLAREALERLSRRIDYMHVVLWPLGPQPELRGATIHRYETAVIDCSHGFEHALAGVRGVTRRMAGQAARRGVAVVRSTTLDDLPAYYAMLQKASTDWGLARPPMSLELLRAVFMRGGADAELWFATVDGERIAGGVVLYGSEELFFWSAAMRREFSTFRPSNALNLRLMQAACDRGVRWYNLGASEGLDGVARFKHDLGAQALIYTAQTTRRPIFGVYERVRGALLASGSGA